MGLEIGKPLKAGPRQACQLQPRFRHFQAFAPPASQFDPEKARWFNHQYLAHTPDKLLVDYLTMKAIEHGADVCEDYVEKVIPLVKERAFLLTDLWDQSHFFFLDPENYDAVVIAKIWKPETPVLLSAYAEMLENVEPFDAATIEAATRAFVQEKGIGMGKIMNPFRVTVVGANAGPGMMQMSEVIGKEYIIPRIRNGFEKIKLITQL